MKENIQNEQVAYYRARAGEYDEWFRRDGRYDRGPQANARWAEEIDQVSDALAAFKPTGDVLELAAGTGWWTERLALYAARVTAVDAAPEVLAINRSKLGAAIRYVEADLFEWQPDRQYDVAFFSFWLSHVPPERFNAFWGMVRACLKPDGRVFFLDSRYEETSTAADHRLEGEDATTTLRRLKDGREFRVVKVFYPARRPGRTPGGAGMGRGGADDGDLLPLWVRHTRPMIRLLIRFLLNLLGLLAVYCWWVEPSWLCVTEHAVSEPDRPLANPVRVLLLTDWHLGRWTRPHVLRSKIKRLLRRHRQWPFDLLLLGGDFIDDDARHLPLLADTVQALREFPCPDDCCAGQPRPYQFCGRRDSAGRVPAGAGRHGAE